MNGEKSVISNQYSVISKKFLSRGGVPEGWGGSPITDYRLPITGFIISSFLLLLSLTSGCAYRLGSPVPKEMRAVHAHSVINRSNEPGIDPVMTSALRHEIQRDGTLRLASETSAAITLAVTVTSIELTPIGYDGDDPTRPIQFRTTVAANVTLTKMADGSVIYEGRQTGESTFTASADFVSGKLGSLPAAANDLAINIVNACVSAWW